jgi:CRISPR-associated protein Csh2
MPQSTQVFPYSTDKSQRSIGTTSVVPYSVNEIHGWINPYSAKYSGLTDEDVKLMFKALWESIDEANTRTKSNQSSLLLLNIIYNNPVKKIYGLDSLIKLNSDSKRDEEFRSIDDFEIDFSRLFDAVSSNDVRVEFYSKIPKIIDKFKDRDKFEAMDI